MSRLFDAPRRLATTTAPRFTWRSRGCPVRVWLGFSALACGFYGPSNSAFGATQKMALPIDINQASAAEWMTLPGIGAKRADAIVQYRTKHRKFSRVSELLRVKGIGVATLARLKPYLHLGAPGLKPTAAPPAHAAKPGGGP